MKASSVAGLVRAWTLPMTVSLILLGSAYALFLGLRINLFTMLLALLGSLLLHAGANVLNDVNDVAKGVDTLRSPTAAYRGHPILQGEIDRKAAAILSYVLVSSGLSIGAFVSYLTGPAVFLLELAGAISLFSYNGPLLNLKALGLGEFLVATVWGPLFVLGGFAASAGGNLSIYAFLVSVPSAMIMMSVIYSNNYRDIETDVAAGVRSFAFRTSKHAVIVYSSALIGAYVLQYAYVFLGILPLYTLLSVFTLPYVYILLRLFKNKAFDIDAKTGMLFTIYNFTVVAGLLIYVFYLKL